MPEAGGSANIYGVLYQLLGTVHWAARVRFHAAGEKDDFDSIQIVVEPSGGGGDLQIHSQKLRIIEQWKAKSDEGSWSMRQVIEKVFPDLYRSMITY